MLDKVDLSGCTSMEEIRTRLKEFRKARNLADDAFLVGTGYDHNDLPGYQHPTAADLDDPELPNPITLPTLQGHMAQQYPQAGKAGTPSTPVPEGGVYGRLADGTPTAIWRRTPLSMWR